jgi:hypothetical protein
MRARDYKSRKGCKKDILGWFSCDSWLFCSACTYRMADGRLFAKLWFWRVSLFAGLCNVPAVCVRRGLACAGVGLFNIMAYYRMALVCGLFMCGRSYNVALCYLAWGGFLLAGFLFVGLGSSLPFCFYLKNQFN